MLNNNNNNNNNLILIRTKGYIWCSKCWFANNKREHYCNNIINNKKCNSILHTTKIHLNT